MLTCMIKLKQVNHALKVWNNEVFGNLRTNISSARVELEKIQLKLANEDFSEGLFNLENEAYSRLDGFLL